MSPVGIVGVMNRSLDDIIKPGQSLQDLTPEQQDEISELFNQPDPEQVARIRATVERISVRDAELLQRLADS